MRNLLFVFTTVDELIKYVELIAKLKREGHKIEALVSPEVVNKTDHLYYLKTKIQEKTDESKVIFIQRELYCDITSDAHRFPLDVCFESESEIIKSLRSLES